MSGAIVLFPNRATRAARDCPRGFHRVLVALKGVRRKLGVARLLRRALLSIDDRTLADLGISRAQAQFLATRGRMRRSISDS